MKGKSKILMIIGIVLLVLGIVTILIVTNKKSKYPDQPISQTSLGTSNEDISFSISGLDLSESALLGVSNEVMVDKVKDFVNSINPLLKEEIKEEGEYYKWSYGDDYVSYELIQNILEFSYPLGIPWDEEEISGDSFSRFVKKYFNKDWEYELSLSEEDKDNQITYYVKRNFNGNLIETTDYHNQTDTLIFKNGGIIYGRILLTEFFNSNVKLPLLSEEKLKTYINVKNYPKEIYPDFSSLQGSVIGNVDYLSKEFEELSNTLGDCKGTSVSVIYLYKRLNQEALMPVYKMELMCDVSYLEQKYSIPAIGYINAVEPEYVLVSE